MTDREERPEPGVPSVSGGEVFGGTVGEELWSAQARTTNGTPPHTEHSPGYLRTLLLLLLAATFFEGYDGAILALVLPAIRDTFNVAESQLGVSRAIIELGLGGAFFLARAGDRWGRRTLLLWSVLGYTVMTALTAVSWDLWSFTAFQALSRVFLGAEYAVAVTMIVEEFPKDRRARVLGLFLMCSAVGAVAVALLLLGGVADLALEWRTLYLIGLLPLLFLAFFRRGIKETQRFQAHAAHVRETGGTLRLNFFEPWRAPFRSNLVLVGLIHLFRSLPLFGATSWFFYFAEREAGMSENALYAVFIGAYGFGTLGYWICGLLMDRIGRRPTAIAFGILAAISSVALFQVTQPVAIGACLILAVFFGLGMAPVTGAISTELFPTYIRNQAAAWARNIFEISGFVLGPLLVGVLGDHYSGAIGSIGNAVTVLVLLFLPAVYLIWRYLPETKGRELEEIAGDHHAPPPAGSQRRAWAIFAAVIVFALVGGFFGVRALGGITRHPSGTAERFLQAVEDGDRETVEKYGSATIALATFGNRPVDFEKIEVFAAQKLGSLYYVPIRTELDNGRKFQATLLVARQGDEMKVVSVSPTLLKVTDDGGPPPAPREVWPMAIIAVIAVTALAEIVLKALRTT